LIVAILVLAGSSTLNTAVNISDYMEQIQTNLDFSVPSANYTVVDILTVAASRCNYVLDISVVVWRAWVLYPESRRIKVMLTISCIAVDFAHIAWKRLRGEGIGRQAAPTLIWAVPLLLTNMIATALVGIRSWCYQRDVHVVLRPNSRRSDPGKVLIVLLETGLVSCSIWVCATM
ncbi:hypothetical protein FB107DRAFT_213411, partial [Schizophyllum commune]